MKGSIFFKVDYSRITFGFFNDWCFLRTSATLCFWGCNRVIAVRGVRGGGGGGWLEVSSKYNKIGEEVVIKKVGWWKGKLALLANSPKSKLELVKFRTEQMFNIIP